MSKLKTRETMTSITKKIQTCTIDSRRLGSGLFGRLILSISISIISFIELPAPVIIKPINPAKNKSKEKWLSPAQINPPTIIAEKVIRQFTGRIMLTKLSIISLRLDN